MRCGRRRPSESEFEEEPRFWTTRVQSSSLVVETVLLLAGGFVFGSVLHNPLKTDAIFFLLVAVGALSYAPFRPWFSRKLFRQLAVALFYLGALFSLLQPANEFFVPVARGAIGMGTGLVYVEFLAKVAEISEPHVRGRLACVAGVAYSTVFWPFSRDSSLGLGITIVILALVAQILLFLFDIESPVHHLSRGETSEAYKAMMRLRMESQETPEILRDVRDLQDMLVDDARKTRNAFSQGNLRPLVLVLLARATSVLTLAHPFVTLRARTLGDGFVAPILVLSVSRLISSLALMFLVDFIGRKGLLSISVWCSSVLTLIMGAFLYFDMLPAVVGALSIAYEIFGGLAFPGIPDILASEAFQVKKKPLSIGLCVALEQLLHGGLVLGTLWCRPEEAPSPSDEWFIPFGFGALTFLVGAFTWLAIPETKRLTYRQASAAFGGAR